LNIEQLESTENKEECAQKTIHDSVQTIRGKVLVYAVCAVSWVAE